MAHAIKADLVRRIASETNIPQGLVYGAVDAILRQMRESLAEADRIELRGFGVFKVAKKKGGLGRNMRTGEVYRIPPGRVVKFRASTKLELPPADAG